jgi:ADP-heptose:LPS heptosyltransferase
MRASEIARRLLAECVAGRAPLALPRELLEDPGGGALFGILAEGLGDRFEPALCDVYARLFAQAIAGVSPGNSAAELLARYQRVRRVRAVTANPRRVFVLSRVTLGADVAVASVALAAARTRFPEADLVFVGPRKNFELFAADPRLRHAPVEYRRGSLRERLAVWDELRALLSQPGSLVIDPDSRLTQLGLLPVSDEASYHLFESRSYGEDTQLSLPELTAAWCAETLGIENARPYLAPGEIRRGPHIAVSLGVGQNLNKSLPAPFEEELLRMLAATGAPLVIDKGAGGEEAARVAQAAERAGVNAEFWDGSFAGFAQIIAGASLYAGYDSAGQHVAAASGVPLITVFAGFPTPRMFDRWRPVSEQSYVVRVDEPDVEQALRGVRKALAALRSL